MAFLDGSVVNIALPATQQALRSDAPHPLRSRWPGSLAMQRCPSRHAGLLRFGLSTIPTQHNRIELARNFDQAGTGGRVQLLEGMAHGI